MRFTLAVFATMVAAVAAFPQKTQNDVHQSSNKEDVDVDVLQSKCGDLVVNCCIINEKEDQSEKGLNLLNDALGLNPPNKAYCSPYSNQGLIPINLGQLLGLDPNERVCDAPTVTYACCNGSDCTEIGNGGKAHGKKEDDF
ncbi:hypothetical protein BJX64DRAFT_291892 [Aspergillus heterothallicus]